MVFSGAGKKRAPDRTGSGASKRDTTLFQPPVAGRLFVATGAWAVTDPPFRPTGNRSGGKLREQSSTELPHRLAASAGSLEAGISVFLPFKVVNASIL